MENHDYSTPAGVYVTRTPQRGFKPSKLVFNRFPTLADAIKYVMEDLGNASNRAWIETDECDFNAAEIKELYDNEGYPIQRRLEIPY
jgi:hypothetical protein